MSLSSVLSSGAASAGFYAGSSTRVAGLPSPTRKLARRGCVRFEGRLQERPETVAAAERVGHADEARHDRSDREEDQRRRHGRRSVMQARAVAMVRGPWPVVRRKRCGGRVMAAFAVEREEDEPEHVGRGQQRRQHADDPHDEIPVRERPEQDLVLAEKARERRDARDVAPIRKRRM
jgi:hypothetical protein